MRRSWLSLACALLPSLAAAQVPANVEFRVNTYTTGQQSTLLSGRTVAAAANGDFVVTWTGDGPTGPGTFAQLFDATLVRRGGEIEVTSGASGDATVAFEPGGGFLAAWLDPAADISLRRFDRNGAPTLGPLVVNTHLPGAQEAPSIAVDNRRGGFMVVWTSEGQDGNSNGIFARRFDAAGAPDSAEFQVNTYVAGDQALGRVASTGAADGFVVAWQSIDQDGDGTGIFAQRYQEGAPLGPEFRVNTYTSGNQSLPRLAAGADGGFVVAWTSDGQYPPGTFSGIYAQRYDADGDPVGGEFRVNTYTSSFKSIGDVAADEAGNFAVTWTSEGQDGDQGGIYARRFAANGTPRGPEFRVNTFTPQIQAFSSAALDPAGNLLVDWINWQTSPAQELDVHARRFGGLLPMTLEVDPVDGPSSDGNHMFEAGESVGVIPSWRNTSSSPQTFSGTAAAFTGPGLPGNPSFTIVDGAAD